MPRDVLHPLSSPQQAVWLEQLLAPDLPCYNIGAAFRIDGPLDIECFDAAVREVAQRNEALHIVLERHASGCMQRFALDDAPALQRLDVSMHDDPEAAAWARIRETFGTTFPLYGARLWKMVWIQVGREHGYWLLCFHHLVADGMSLALLSHAVTAAYNRLARGEARSNDDAEGSYLDFMEKDAEYLASPRFAKDREFWLQRFSTLPEPLFDTADAKRGRGDRAFGQVVWKLDRGAFERLSEIGTALGGSSTHFLMAALATYFARVRGREGEVVIGMPTYNRSGAVQRRTIGMFSSASPVGVHIDPVRTFAQTLQDVAAELKRGYRHQRFPLPEIHRHLLAGTSDRRGLFDIQLSVESFVVDLPFEGGIRSSVIPLHNGYERQPLAIYVRDYQKKEPVHVEFNFDPDVLPPEEMADHVRRLERLTLAAIDAPETALADLPLMDEAERTRVVYGFNTPRLDTSATTPVHVLFERQAAQRPDAIAVECDDLQLGYGELNARANRLARHLRGLGVRKDALVALCLERGVDMVVAILATLKAGGAYVPLDPAHPDERLAHMLSDSAPVALLTHAALAERLDARDGCARVVLDAAPWERSAWAGESVDDLGVEVAAADLAYVIYTSGSTGVPKGVMVDHGNVSRLFAATHRWFGFGRDDVWTLFHSFAFDFSVWELWGALVYGGRLVVVPYATSRSPQEFHRLVCARGVTVLSQTPSAFRQFIAADAASDRRHGLRHVVFGGEALEMATLKPWYAQAHNQGTRLVNMYGITETTVHVTYRALEAADAERPGASPIGERIPDLAIYVLDANGRPLPVGVAGELYVAGAGVARGYLRRPELDAQRFLEDPFVAGGRMYRTGDLGRYLRDGTLEYLGRNDSQVKIRGFRIELGEIEAQLMAIAGVRDAVVIARERGEDAPGERAGLALDDKRLVAYVVLDELDELDERAGNAGKPDAAALREQLRARLPEYMVPVAYVALTALPLTANGKLDRKALPAPEGDALQLRAYSAPQGGTEASLATLWSELLGAPRVGRDDNFFELGGHSILAVQLMERMHRIGLRVDIRGLFAARDLAALAAAVSEADGEDDDVPPNGIPEGCTRIAPEMLPLVELDHAAIARIVAATPGGAANIQDIYPLAPLQEGILFHHLMQASGDAYVLPALLSFDNRERLDRFVDALNTVIARHDILRTAVLWEELDAPVQVVWRHAALEIETLSLEPAKAAAPEESDVRAQLQARADARRIRIDVRRAPMVRAYAAYDPTAGSWLLQLLLHHLTLDHTTTELILQEVALLLQGRAAELPAPVAFRAFVARARRGVSEAEHEAFFRDMLGDGTEPTAPFGLLDVQGDGSRVVRARLTLPPALSSRLRRVASARGVGAASVFHLAWAQLLAVCSGRDDVLFGTVLFGRMQGGAGADRAMGMFINTLPLRAKLGAATAEDSLREVHARLTGLMRHEHAPLTLAQRCSGLPSGTPLFSALLNYRHSRTQSLDTIELVPGVQYVGGRDLTNYPFALYVDDLGTDFALTAEIHDAVPAERVAAFMQQTLESLAEALEHAPTTPMHALGVVPAVERDRVLHGFNDTRRDDAVPASVHEAFERQAAADPARIALELDGETLTYRELDERANRLARHLRGLGVGPDARVAICLERSLEMVVGVLATLKAGGAYVPVDPAYPDDRIAHMLRDSAPAAVLSQTSLLARIDAPASVVVMDAPNPAWMGAATSPLDSDNDAIGLRSEHLAFVIYTSGSTGLPKGVAMPHGALVNLLAWQRKALPEPARTLQFAALGFDVAFQEIFSTLTSGGTLVLVRETLRQDLPALAEWLREAAIERLFLPYIALNTLSELWSQRSASLPMLKDVITAGEQLRITPAIRRMFAQNPRARLHNHYGPTESHVVTTHLVEGPAAAWEDLPPIGHPVGNCRIYLLDARRQPVPVGVAGELWIGGAQVARGYLHRPELTAERFVDDPFVGERRSPHAANLGGGRMYRTGDLGSWREDGSVAYLGRNDFQVKIRGYRIELGEIEAQLSRVPGVREAAVMAREDVPGDKRLVAYVVADEGASLDPAHLRAHLGERVPDYMVPAAYVVLQALPLTPNGKLDRKALPAPEGEAFLQRAYAAPQGEIETALAAIWSELLGAPRVGRHDHFFELGGHSLLAIRMVEQLRRRGWSVEIRALFAQPELAALASAIGNVGDTALEAPANAIPDGCTAIVPSMLPLVALEQREIDGIVAATPGGAANLQDIYPLAPLQAGILFHHLLQRDLAQRDTYVLPTLLGFDSRERLDRFVDALNTVIARHDILRTALHWDGLSEPVQAVWRHASLELEVLALDPAHGDARTQLQSLADARIDVRRAPMLRAQAAFDAAERRWLLRLSYHHVAMDHVTLELLVDEIELIQQGRATELPPAVPFRAFVAQARRGVSDAEHERFFRAMLADTIEPTAPFGLLDVQGDGSRVAEARRTLPSALSSRLRRLAKAHGVGAASLFHLAWAQLLAQCSGRDDVVFGTVLFGRMQGVAGADRAVGLFINTLPLRVTLSGRAVHEALQATHAALTGLLRHEHASLALVQRCSGLPAGVPLFSALLNYRHSHVAVGGNRQVLEGVEFLGVHDRTNYPFGLYVDDTGRDFELTLQIDRAVPAERIASFVEQTLESLAQALEHAPATPMQAIAVLPAAESERVLHGFNDTHRNYVAPGRVHEGVEQKAAAHPERIALELDGERLSYRALNERANVLAHHLRGLGVGPDTRIVICLERSLEMVVAILATLKAGGAYVPVAPAYPDERITQVLRDCAPVAVLTQTWLLARMETSAPVLVMDGANPAWMGAATRNLDANAIGLRPEHLAYVIYTSGSTGLPKGVAMPHGALANLLAWQQESLPEPARTLQFAALGFDVAFQEIFSTLTSGGTVVLIREALRQDLPALAEWLGGAAAIERLFLPYIALNTLSELWSQQNASLPTLKDVITAGEQLRITPAIRRMFARHPGARLHNHYGPTENHLATAHLLEGPAASWEDLPPIGRPIGNCRIYLLDAQRQPVPVGVAGELWIGGAQVAQGYLHRPELTAERFVDDPFVVESRSPHAANLRGRRMYRTGDLGSWREDGSVAYLGRNDFQVKIRGYRIELGEIEAQLSHVPGVREAAVMAREDVPGDKRLVAYVVADEGASLDPAHLRAHLGEQVPDYMVPAAYVVLEALPLTPNGKLDRKALPAPEGGAFLQRAYAAPQGEIETALAAIWSELLGAPRIGRHDHFFELGGHSLLAIRVVSQVRQRLDVELSLSALFTHPQLADLAGRVATAEQAALSAIVPADRTLPLPLSPAQQRLWFIAGVDTDASIAYHIPGALRLRGALDTAALQAALDRIVERHEALRTRFVARDGRPYQIVDSPRPFALIHEDASGADAQTLEVRCTAAAAEPFDLAAGPPIRGRLLRIADDDHVLLLVMHHIVSDGWSLSVLMRELSALYDARRSGRPDSLAPLAIQYVDYAVWQQRWLEGPVAEQHLREWVHQLRGAPELVDLPLDRPRPAVQDYRGASIDIALDARLSESLRELGRRHGATLYMIVLAAWASVVARLSGRHEVVIGSSHAGRNRAEIEPLIGFFIHTQALKIDLDGAADVAALLAQVRQNALRAQELQDVPFERLVEALNPTRSMAHHPVFQLMLTWNNTPATPLALPGLLVEKVASLPASAQFDLALDLEETGEGIAGRLNYATALFDDATVRRHWAYVQAMLRGMAEDETRPLEQVPLLDAAERRQVLRVFNEVGRAEPRAALAHTLFERQAAQRPEAIALEHDGERLSYGELNVRANRLAHYLRGLGVGPDARVAICLERGFDMVVALLATLKAGGAYVPLDPAYPSERLAHMLGDGDGVPVAVLTQHALRDRLRLPPGCAAVMLDATPQNAPPWAEAPAHDPDPAAVGLEASHMAYVIYTSGSTGTPKGVMVEHRHLCHQAAALNTLYSFRPEDRVLQFAALSFDVAGEEIFGALLHGATLVLRTDAWLTDPRGWCALCERHALTIANLPTLFWQRLALDADAAIPPRLRQIVIGGDTVSAAALTAWWRREGHRPALANAYGPTETTINATVARCAAEDSALSIGRPVANTRIYVLDARREPAPLGAVGELWIGGAGVARGYLGRADLTAERFVEDPFADEAGARMYRSGDLGRWRTDGALEFLGRNDFQIKIRGFRIELGEIEAQLARIDGIGEAVVTAREDASGDKRLVAYVVAAAGAPRPDPAQLRAQLTERLPSHMVPAAYVVLDGLPLMANGKLDRRALPAPEVEAYVQRAYAAPEGATEETLAQVWRELLGVERIGRDDDFFEHGGHSLLAVRMISQLRQRLGVELPLAALFAHPRLAELARDVAAAEQSALSAIVPADRSAPLPLSFAQQRLWFVTRIDAQAATAYHIPGALRLRGQLDRDALQAALDRILERHEALRTRFIVMDGQPRQVVDPPRGLAMAYADRAGADDAELAQICREEAVAPFDLERRLPIRARLLRLGEQDHLLLVTMHHIVADGWSLSILAGELSVLYRAFRAGKDDPQPPLAFQYGDYASWQRKWLQGPLLREHLQYWVDRLRDAPELIALPTDRPRPPQQDYRGAMLDLELDEALSAGLRALALRHGVTLYMIVLAAWASVLSRWSGQTQVVIGSSIAGRDRAELEPLIGFFVNAQALRFDLEGASHVRELLARARRIALDAQTHRDVPFEQVVEALNPARSMAYNPVYQVRLAWQNTPETRLELDGLQFESLRSNAGSAQFDLSLDLEERGANIVGQLNYATALFDEATVRRHAGHLEAMLRGMVEDEDRAMDRIPLLDAAERAEVLHGFNDTRGDESRSPMLLHALFERHAAAQPDVLAIECDGESLGYAALNERANRLAHHLRGLGVRPDARVAICAERSVDMVVAMLAVLKAGGAFVPLDPVHPDERLTEMLDDCAPVALLTQARLRDRLRPTGPAAGCTVLMLDAAQPSWADAPAHDPDPAEIGLDPSHLAYVIYTSGSTGVPKGVMVEHRNVLTFLHGLEERIHGPAPDCRRIAWNSSFGFDMAVKAWGQLCMGRSVHLVPERVRLDGQALLDFVERHAIEAMECTPSHLRMLQGAGFAKPESLRGRTLRKLLLGGEAIDTAMWHAMVEARGIAFHNMYGPTECSVDATCGPIEGEVPHIGRPMPNACIYVLDPHREPVPIGAPGEIWIGGAGVARGYLHRPELTAERFVDDPFSGTAGARMYRTGDLGRWRKDGTIEYAGRNDFQVKVRGFRIELGEIEARLAQLDGVREAVVMAREDNPGEKRLVAYVVAHAGVAPHPSVLREQLGAQLPEYMLPAAYVLLDALPLNANGKLDRKALPAPDGEGAAQRGYEAPAPGTERALAVIWSDLLGVERVGRHDNFFELGGHSALAIRLIQRMSELQLQVDVQMIFNAPTLAHLASATVQLEEVVL